MGQLHHSGSSFTVYSDNQACVFVGRRVSSTSIPAQQVEARPSNTFHRIRVAPLEQNADDGRSNAAVEVEEPPASQTKATEPQDAVTNGHLGDATAPTSSSTNRRSKAMWQSAMKGVVAATSTTTSSETSDTRWQRTLTKVRRRQYLELSQSIIENYCKGITSRRCTASYRNVSIVA